MNRKLVVSYVLIMLFVLFFGYTSLAQDAISNGNFTSDDSGWDYGEVDTSSVADAGWQSSGGNYDEGVYRFVHDDTDSTNPVSEQWANYSFSISEVIAKGPVNNYIHAFLLDTCFCISQHQPILRLFVILPVLQNKGDRLFSFIDIV